MGVAVAIVPGALMAVVPAGRKQPIQLLRQILLETRFKLDGSQGGGAADHKEGDRPTLQTGAADSFCDLFCQIVHIPMPACAAGELLMNNQDAAPGSVYGCSGVRVLEYN